MKINFIKIQAQGNDYIFFDFTKTKKPDLDFSLLIKEISQRNFSIGSDGLVIIDKSTDADAFMDIYNADGSRAKMCGSALRSVVYYLHCNDKENKQTFKINTLSGIKDGQVLNDKSVKVNMGKAKIIKKNLNIENFKGNYISVGNPHFVILSDNISYENTNIFGPQIEKNSFFENGVNIEFAQIINNNNIKMFVWERGSKQTYACGTGACAVFYSAFSQKLVENEVNIHMLGGEVKVSSQEDNIYLTGKVNIAFHGFIEL